MASLRTRNDSTAVLFRLNGTQTSETFTGPNRAKEAAKFKRLVERVGAEAAVEAHGAREQRGNDNVPLVADWCYHHIEQLTGVEEGTRSDYRSYVRLSIEPHVIGSLPIDVVTEEHVERWVNHLATKGRADGKGGLGGKTIFNRHSLLSDALSRAVKRKLIGDNPAKGVPLPEPEFEDMVFLTHGEFAVLHAHFPLRWRPLVSVLAGHGPRWSEATAFQVRDCHLDDPVPTLTVVRAWKHTDGKPPLLKSIPKSKKGRRSFGLSPRVVELLRPLVAGRPPDAFIFTGARGGPVRHADFLRRVWQPAVKAATATVDKDGNEIPADLRIAKWPRIHDMRHTYASWMIAQGMSLTDLQYYMGHESIKTTSDRYGHLMPGHRERAAAFSEIALAQALPELA